MLESSVNIVQSRAVARKLIDEITSAGRAFQSRALVTGKARLPTAESRDVGTAEVYDDHDLGNVLLNLVFDLHIGLFLRVRRKCLL